MSTEKRQQTKERYISDTLAIHDEQNEALIFYNVIIKFSTDFDKADKKVKEILDLDNFAQTAVIQSFLSQKSKDDGLTLAEIITKKRQLEEKYKELKDTLEPIVSMKAIQDTFLEPKESIKARELISRLNEVYEKKNKELQDAVINARKKYSELNTKKENITPEQEAANEKARQKNLSDLEEEAKKQELNKANAQKEKFIKLKEEYQSAMAEFDTSQDSLIRFSKESQNFIEIIEPLAAKNNTESSHLTAQIKTKKSEIDKAIENNRQYKQCNFLAAKYHIINDDVIQETQSSLEELKKLNESNAEFVKDIESFFKSQEKELSGIIDNKIQTVIKELDNQFEIINQANSQINAALKENEEITQALHKQSQVKPQKINDLKEALGLIKNTVYAETEKKVTAFPAVLKFFSPNGLIERQNKLPEIIAMNELIKSIENNIIEIENFSSNTDGKALLEAIAGHIDKMKKILKTTAMSPKDKYAIELKLDAFEVVAINTAAYHNAKFNNGQTIKNVDAKIALAQIKVTGLNSEEKTWSEMKSKLGNQPPKQQPKIEGPAP